MHSRLETSGCAVRCSLLQPSVLVTARQIRAGRTSRTAIPALTTCLMRFSARVFSPHWPSKSDGPPREPSYRDNRVIEGSDMLIHLPPTLRRTAGLRTRELISFEAKAPSLRKPAIGLRFPVCCVSHPQFLIWFQAQHASDDNYRMTMQRILACRHGLIDMNSVCADLA